MDKLVDVLGHDDLALTGLETEFLKIFKNFSLNYWGASESDCLVDHCSVLLHVWLDFHQNHRY